MHFKTSLYSQLQIVNASAENAVAKSGSRAVNTFLSITAAAANLFLC